eukprot:9968052-Heterocapsa_arctica.AAC.1
MEAYGFSINSASVEAYSNHSSANIAPELNQHLVINITVYYRDVIKGLLSGNQNHRTDMLTWSPSKASSCLIELEDTNRECRHRRKIES